MFEWFDSDNKYYIVMEYADGGDLYSEIKARARGRKALRELPAHGEDDHDDDSDDGIGGPGNGPLGGSPRPVPEEQVWDYFRQTASGLLYLHRQKIIHRDVKVRTTGVVGVA